MSKEKAQLSFLLFMADMLPKDELLDMMFDTLLKRRNAIAKDDVHEAEKADALFEVLCMMYMQKTSGISALDTLEGIDELEKLKNLITPHKG